MVKSGQSTQHTTTTTTTTQLYRQQLVFPPTGIFYKLIYYVTELLIVTADSHGFLAVYEDSKPEDIY